MSNAVTTPADRVPIDDLAVLVFEGADVARFLQGQLSQDIARLAVGHALLAGYHNAQGRVIAILRLASLTPECILAALPRELVEDVSARLRRFVLRARVTVADAGDDWHVEGRFGPAGALAVPLEDARSLEFVRGPRRETLEAAQGTLRCTGREAWRARDIAAGLPQVYRATSEAFVAQMLNLDVLGGIAFDKGCYTGQEVIARAHYRGRVKRRLQRFRTRDPQVLAAGDGGVLDDGRTFRVVEAVACADGRSEFLAVAPLAAVGGEAEGSGNHIPCETLPLPYALPD
jgi:hypothetical protein